MRLRRNYAVIMWHHTIQASLLSFLHIEAHKVEILIKIGFPNCLLIRDDINVALYIISFAKEKTIPLYVSFVI